MRICNFLMRQYTRGRGRLILGCILQLVISAGALINAEIMRRGILAIRQKDMDMLTNAGILLAVVIILNIVCAFAQKMYRRQAGLLYQEQLQADILSGVLGSDNETRAALQVGGMLTMIINNAEAAVERSISCIMEYAAGFLGIGACAIYMFLIDWRITLVIILVQILVRFLLLRLDRGIREFSDRVISAMKESNSLTVEILNNMLTVRNSGREDYFNDRVQDKEEKLSRLKTAQHFFRLGKDDLVWAATSFSEYVIMYGLGGVLVCLGKSDVSVVLALAFVIGPFVTGVNRVGYASSDRIEALANIDSVSAFLGSLRQEGQKEAWEGDGAQISAEDGEKICLKGGAQIAPRQERGEREGCVIGDHSIRVRKLYFSYGDREILHGIDLDIASGEAVELVGASGSGKSTLLSLLTGVRKSHPGVIRIGGRDAAAQSLRQLSEAYCYISQKSSVFAGSVCENIAMSSVPDKDLCRKILKLLNISHCEEMDPFLLSQGEKQRVNIGRAFYRYAKKKTGILFCDEIFSNLDQKNAEEIARSMKAYFQGCTIVFVAHQDINISFDRILRMREGRLETIEGRTV